MARVYVFADWEEFADPVLIGTLRSSMVRQKEHFSFNYDTTWLQSPNARQIDPDLDLYPGDQHGEENRNFRVFLDSCPDRWGRLLMKRREAIVARQEGRDPRFLNEIDYLLGVHDLHRTGALRFKRELDGPFLDHQEHLAAPPLSTLRDLEHATRRIEEHADHGDPEYQKWLNLLISPGASLGGARPKASVIGNDHELWIAKFPSRLDDYDKGAWEFLAYRLAQGAGIIMPPCKLAKFGSHHHTFLTKRFDRTQRSRLHFTSAMTQLGHDDGDDGASYLELAQFLTEHGANTKEDLSQLWRRIVFYIALSNTDDHLRNHGFILGNGGWLLSPAYDINPMTPANGLHLNITDNDNRLDYDLALQVIEFFQLDRRQADRIKDEVVASVTHWQPVARSIGIGRGEQQLMELAFNL